jgi:hypothetical protein
MEISISEFLFKNIHSKNKEIIQDILNIIHNEIHTSRGFLKSQTNKLLFRYQSGGKKYETTLADSKTYEYHLSSIKPLDDNRKMMHFINLNEDFEDCLFLIYDTVESGNSNLIIQGIMNRNDCVKCKDDTHIYRTGDILMQILLSIVNKSSKFAHIKTIKLSDISKKMCFNLGLELKYLRTITHGIPFYAKYGFRPTTSYDQNVFKHNRNLFTQHKQLHNLTMLELIEDNKSKFDKNIYDNIYKKYFYNYLHNNEQINPEFFIKNIIDMTEMKTISDNEKRNICKFLHSIYKDIFKLIGYTEYNEDKWCFRIRT